MSIILEIKFLNAFSWLKIYDSWLNFHYIGSLGFSWKWTNIGSASISFQQNIELRQLREYYSYTRIYVQPSNIIYIKIFVYLRIHLYIQKKYIFVYVYMYALIYPHFDDSVQDRSNSIDNALGLPQPCIKPSIYTYLSWAHCTIHSQTTTKFNPLKLKSRIY